jgi:hypothetical protein
MLSSEKERVHMKGNIQTNIRVLAVALLLLIPTAVHAQTAATPPRPNTQGSVQPVGRFQLVPLPEGTMFLIDSATGRVWRYTQLVPTEAEVSAAIDADIIAEGKALGVVLGRVPDLTRDRRVREELRAKMNPCAITTACFLEVERFALRERGWSSEVLAK